MNRKHIHCLTLRLDPQLDDLLTETAFENRTSKSSWIRMAIRQRLRDQRPETSNRVQEKSR
jgi:hypothetical protein